MEAQLILEQEPKTYAVVFAKGDDFLGGLTALAKRTGLAASAFTAVGAFERATLGYFDREEGDYVAIPVEEQVEVLSLVGNIALEEGGEPKIHAHVVVGLRDGSTRGGHVLDARVWPTLEVIVTESPRHLRRRTDPETGLALLQPAT